MPPRIGWDWRQLGEADRRRVWLDPQMGIADDIRRQLNAEQSNQNDLALTAQKYCDVLSVQLDRLIPECVQALQELGISPPRMSTPPTKRGLFKLRKQSPDVLVGWTFSVQITHIHIDEGDSDFSVLASENGSWSWLGGPMRDGSRVAREIGGRLAKRIEPLLPESEQRDYLFSQVTEMARRDR